MDCFREGITLRTLFGKETISALELRILIEQAIGLTHVQQIAHPDYPLAKDEMNQLNKLLVRRQAGEPIAYITGIKEFFGLPFHVSSDVLIPRPETELLVELAIKYLPKQGNIVDLGTGSGAIAISIAHERSDAMIIATDLSREALTIARLNAKEILHDEKRISFREGNWFNALDIKDVFDVIVSNPPYIHSMDPHLLQGDLRFEPKKALTDFRNGLSALETIIKEAPQFLKMNGWLFLEHGYNQAEDVKSMLVKYGFTCVQSWQDLAGINRVSGGCWRK